MPLWFQKNQERLLAPLLFLAVFMLTFGLQITRLGFYFDDWVILNAYNLGGSGRLFEYAFLDNRPLAFLPWVIGLKLFGTVPLYWQIWTLLWRGLTVLILWKAMLLLWPKAFRQVTLAALLFAVYPLFAQQASALTYSFHWICFFLWGLSVYLMILAIRQPKRFFLWMILSLLADGLQLFTQEYYLGLELLRPFILWIALQPDQEGFKTRARRVVLAWSPFLFLLLGFLVWRTLLIPTSGADSNAPQILYGLLSSPVSTLPKLIIMILQDTVYTLLGIWYRTYQPDLFVFSPVSNLAAWGVVVLCFASVFFFFWQIRNQNSPRHAEDSGPWYRSAIPFGFAALIFGFLPGWMIGRHVYDLTGIYNDRFGIASMFGAAILIVGLVELLFKTDLYRLVVICLLIGLGAGQNFRYETNYRWSWEKQLKLYWQLKWRAPDLKTPAGIYGDGAIVSYLGSWVTTSALNQMYPQESQSHFVDLMYFDLTKLDVSVLEENGGTTDLVKVKYMDFQAPENSSLVIAFEPEKLQCLWVLGPQDVTNPYLSEPLAESQPISNLDQILPGPAQPLRADIFGREPAHDWCYYYETADLARQKQEWQGIVSLWKQAEQDGKHPRVGVEYGPFIEGFAHTGGWNTAIDLTSKASFPKYEMRAYLCATWRRISDTTADTTEKQQSIQRVIEDFECRDEFAN